MVHGFFVSIASQDVHLTETDNNIFLLFLRDYKTLLFFDITIFLLCEVSLSMWDQFDVKRSVRNFRKFCFPTCARKLQDSSRFVGNL